MEDKNTSQGIADFANQATAKPAFSARKGDLFADKSGSVMLSILDVVSAIGTESIYLVRVYPTVNESIHVSKSNLISYIEENSLEKLKTPLDSFTEVANNLVLAEGDLFTKSGIPFLEILSDELPYIDNNGAVKLIVFARFSDQQLPSFRDSLFIKDKVFGLTDQFPPQTVEKGE